MAEFENTFEGGKLAAYHEIRDFVRRRATKDPGQAMSDVRLRLNERCALGNFVPGKRMAEKDADDGYSPGDLIPGSEPKPTVEGSDAGGGGGGLPSTSGGGEAMEDVL